MKRFLKRHPKKLLALLAILLAGSIWWWTRGDDTAEAAYTITTASTGSLEESVSAQGTLEPKEYVNVGAQVSGQLQKLHVEVGDVVSASQLVAEIDPRVYESRLEETQAQVKGLQAQLDLARQQHARNAQLVEAQAVSRDVFETSLAQVKSLQAQLEQANSTLSEAKTNLSYTKIYAPIGGTVISQTAREGQTLNANQTAPTVVEVADLSVMTVRAQVAEADIGKIKPGMPLYFTTLGSDQKWRTTVKQVIPSPDIVNDVVLYNVLADVDNPETKLMSGMSTQMNFVIGEAKDAVVIPATALGKKMGETQEGRGTPYQVFVPQGEEMVSKTVYVGLMNRTSAQITSGLRTGDQVAVPTGTGEAKGTPGGGRARAMGPRF